ncbi:unnamed protein product [Caenorhabditis sp. 36 PRJEB53466]|nr:unnamed protein product [Caenorhabditis sp. 36 PRJEB53466]
MRHPRGLVKLLLQWFEAGKGYIEPMGRREIMDKWGITYTQISKWSYDRMRRNGLYGEIKFFTALGKFVRDHPNEQPSAKLFAEYTQMLKKIRKIHNIGATSS